MGARMDVKYSGKLPGSVGIKPPIQLSQQRLSMRKGRSGSGRQGARAAASALLINRRSGIELHRGKRGRRLGGFWVDVIRC